MTKVKYFEYDNDTDVIFNNKSLSEKNLINYLTNESITIKSGGWIGYHKNNINYIWYKSETYDDYLINRLIRRNEKRLNRIKKLKRLWNII